jgi:hypothetical protein
MCDLYLSLCILLYVYVAVCVISILVMSYDVFSISGTVTLAGNERCVTLGASCISAIGPNQE